MSTPANARLWLVVPCYNEAARLQPDPFRRLAGAGVSILFVDDGSTDATPRLLAEIARSSDGRVEVMTLPRNAGKASAVQRGVAAVLQRETDFVGYWDADLSAPLEAVWDFLALAVGRPTIEAVIGSRVKLLGRRIVRHTWRHYIGRVFATGASLALGLPVYDTQCGAKVFRASDLARSVFGTPFRSRWVFDVELLARYVAALGPEQASSRIVELPLEAWTEVPGSKVRSWHAIRAAFDLVRIGLTRASGRRS
jgi:glycosyltransferase involved in cell wall biosynthesis